MGRIGPIKRSLILLAKKGPQPTRQLFNGIKRASLKLDRRELQRGTQARARAGKTRLKSRPRRALEAQAHRDSAERPNLNDPAHTPLALSPFGFVRCSSFALFALIAMRM
jgi:hypothetical protein